MTVYFSDFHPSELAQGAKGSAAFAGTTNIAILQLYKRSATTLTNSDKPNGSVTYTFATATSNLSNVTNGWSTTIPSGSDPLYVVGATAASSEATDTIAANEWSTPVILVQNGAGGLNTATVFLFKRGNTSTPPPLPTQSATYTFATGVAVAASTSGNTVFPYLNGWTQTAPDSAGNKYLFITTAAAINTGATTTIEPNQWAEVRILSQDGAVGYTAYLTNEAHTLAAAPNGEVTNYTGASGQFKVFLDGVGDISQFFSIEVLSNPQTLTVTTSTLPALPTYSITGGFDILEETASITLRGTGTGAYAGVIIDKVFSLSKSKAGAPGAPSKLLSLSSNRQLISYDSSNALSPSSQDISLSVSKQNTTATVSWTIQDTLGNTLTPSTYLSATTGDSVTLTAANFNSAISVGPSEGIIITATANDAGLIISDRVTIMKVRAGVPGAPGSNNAIVYLYQRSSTVPTNPTGNFVYTFSTGALSLGVGGNLGSWTQTIPSGSNPLYVIAATASSTSTTDTIAGNEFSSPVVLAQDGAAGSNTAIVYLYQRSSTVPPSPSGNFTYTFSSGVLTGGNLGSWSQTIPSGTSPLYIIAATAGSNTATDTIAANEFSSPVILAQNGAPGDAGFNAATVYLYQRSTTTPTIPTGPFTYTFSSGLLTGGTLGSWTQTIPSGTNPLYVIAATAISNTASDSIASSEFSAPVVLVQNGAPGDAGFSAATVYLYQRSTTLPAKPTGTFTYTFSSGLLTGGTLGSWTQTIPSGTNPLYVITATAVSNTATDSILGTEFSDPVILVQNGTAGLNNATINLYLRSPSAPAALTGTFTYTFATNAITESVGSWTRNIPTGTDPVYIITGLASSNGPTASVTFSSPVLFVQNGAPGNNATRTAILEMYQWSFITPVSFPQGQSTYTWSSGTFSAPANPNGWSITPGSPSPGQVLYAVRQIYTDTAISATSTVTWSATTSAPAGAAGTNASPGTAAISAFLTSESIQLMAFANGNVSSYGNATGSFKVYSGNTDISSSFTLSTPAGTQFNPQGLTINYSNQNYSVTGGFDANEDTASITIRATGSGAYSGVTLDKILSLSKARGGYEIVSALPTTNNFEGRVVFLTATDGANAAGKLYRYVSGAFTAAVPAADISGVLVGSQIDSGAISTAKFASGIEPVSIVASLPTSKTTNTVFFSNKLYRWNGSAYTVSVPTSDLTGTITGTQIDDGSISTDKLASNAVTAAKISAGTITSAQIDSNTITAGNIATGAITADEVAAGAITTTKLFVSGKGSAINDDPLFQDPSAWEDGAHGSTAFQVTVTDAIAGNTVYRSGTGGGSGIQTSKAYPVSSSKNYRLKGALRNISGNGTAYLRLLDQAGNQIFISGLEAFTPGSSWQYFSGNYQPPSSVKSVRLRAILNWVGSGPTGYQEITDFKLEEMAEADLIVDGAIVANKIATNAVTTLKLDAGAVTANKIATDAVEADKIKAGAITAAKIAVDAITADKILSGTVLANIFNVGNTNFRLDGAAKGAGRGSLIVSNGSSDILTVGYLDATNVGFSLKDASGNILFQSSTGVGTTTSSNSYASAIANSSISVDPTSGQLNGVGGTAAVVANSKISIGNNGALAGAGGGQVTIGGLGYSGDLDATKGAVIGGNLSGQFTPDNSATFFASAAIKNAQIESLSAAKITSGTIAATSLITVGTSGTNAALTLDGQKRQILVKDASGAVRVKIGDLSV
jgi:hypothetical protein